MSKSLTIGEVAKVEELSGLSAAQFEDNDKPRALLAAAMAYIIRRRDDPKVKFSDLLEMDVEAVEGIVTAFKEASQAADKSVPE